MAKISALAQVDSRAVIGDDVEIGPFCVVGPDVKLGAGCRLMSHVVIVGHTTVGRENVFHPHCVVGDDPQDKKYRGGATRLEIGDRNQIREAATIHTGTELGGGLTRVGNDNLIMINVHVGHDAHVGDHCILSNNVALAGHVVVEDYANILAMVGVHHFVTIGKLSFCAAMARIQKDVPPFMKVDPSGRECHINKEGLRRAKFAEADIEALDQVSRRLFSRQEPMSAVVKSLAGQNGLNRHVGYLLQFLERRDMGKHGRYLEAKRSPESLRRY